MHFVTFIVALVFFLIAAILFAFGLLKLYQGKGPARGLISNGFMIGLLGVLIAAIVFVVFSL